MIKRYCDRCGQQIDEGVHAWYVLELHGTDGEFRHKELCEECYEYLCEKDEAPKADRKTKPTISKMEQVEESTEITYQNCSDALLKMWMDNVLTDAEYNRIMDKLNNTLRKDEPQTACDLWKKDSSCFGCYRYDICQEAGIRVERSE